MGLHEKRLFLKILFQNKNANTNSFEKKCKKKRYLLIKCIKIPLNKVRISLTLSQLKLLAITCTFINTLLINFG